jgi:hypothetical protein
MQVPRSGMGPLPNQDRGWLVYVVITLAVAFVVFYAMVGVARARLRLAALQSKPKFAEDRVGASRAIRFYLGGS